MSSTIVPPNSADVEWARRRHIEELTSQFRTVWDIYIKFYTVFLTFSLAAIAFVAGTNNQGPKGFVALAFVVQSVMTLGTTIGVGIFSSNTAKELERSVREIAGRSEAEHPWLPHRLACYSAFANSVGLVLFIGIWLYIAFS
jgi:hypothetical protein